MLTLLLFENQLFLHHYYLNLPNILDDYPDHPVDDPFQYHLHLYLLGLQLMSGAVPGHLTILKGTLSWSDQ